MAPLPDRLHIHSAVGVPMEAQIDPRARHVHTAKLGHVRAHRQERTGHPKPGNEAIGLEPEQDLKEEGGWSLARGSWSAASVIPSKMRLAASSKPQRLQPAARNA
jgi:hypothetical protein